MLVANKEVLAIFNTIGCGAGAIFDLEQSRYGKIIIGTDSDQDGSHISNLVAGLFFHHAPELIKAGRVYKLESPYYRWEHDGKEEYFFAHEKDKIDFSKGKVHKLKGLGSSSVEETKKFITGKGRRLIQLKYDEFNEPEVLESSKLLYSSLERKNLMLRFGVIEEGL